MCPEISTQELAASLQQSKINRSAMLKKFGFIPGSVLKLSRSKLHRSLFHYAGDANQVANMKNDPKTKEKAVRLVKAGYAGGAGTASGRGVGKGHTGLTIMAAELVEFFVKYYAEAGDNYLDPFMGQGVQMQVAKILGLNYYGYDISREFFTYTDQVRAKIDDGHTTIQIYCGDSKTPDLIPDNIGDFGFTSPPYWDVEYYGDEEGQLGYRKTYPEFLQGMEQVAAAWLPKFRQGAYFVINVNDLHRDGKFIPYHADTIALFQRAGWDLRDIWIIDGLVGGLMRGFMVAFNMKRVAPKLHEYALVFRKP